MPRSVSRRRNRRRRKPRETRCGGPSPPAARRRRRARREGSHSPRSGMHGDSWGAGLERAGLPLVLVVATLQVLELLVDLLEEGLPLVAGLGLGLALVLRGLVGGHLGVGGENPEIDVLDPVRDQALFAG